MANVVIYPFKYMNITQPYYGTVSHYPHTSGNIKDYPIDEAGNGTGRDPMYAPCDVKVVRIYGVGNRGTNTVWVTSTSKVKFANGKTDYLTMMMIHPNDDDIRRLWVGQVIKKGSVICYEGSDGATGNHVHLSVGMGTIAYGGWLQNSNGKWVLTTSGGTVKPEDAFYLDKTFTEVYRSNGITFKDISTAKKSSANKAKVYHAGTYVVTTDLLNVRKGPSTAYAKVPYKNFSDNAKEQIKKLNGGKAANGYVKGVTCTVYQVKKNWGKTPSGWICLDYCKVK